MRKSFVDAFRGLKIALLSERNLRVHVIVLVLTFTLGFYFKVQNWEWCVILLASALVISLELINTAIEHLADLVEPDQHPIVGKVKDISAAAVLISAIAAIALAVVIFLKYFLQP